MARARLEYDDSGTTFYYFLLSFYALLLLPITYFLYPRKKKDEDTRGLECQCEGCQAKKSRLQLEKPNKWLGRAARYAVLIVLWTILFLMVYKVLTTDKDYIEYDPFEILELDPGASMSQIRKQYRRLSKVFHPDKQGGDQAMFMKIAKAYEALTDDVSRENWEKYGNPDGPQAASFGIALPSWIVEKQNSLWVLLVYMCIFMVALPIIVGVWWYRSIKYGSSNVLLQTTQLFGFFLNHTKYIPVKRVLMVLTAAVEFNPELSKLMPTRPSDDVELSKIIASKTLPHAHVKTKERVFNLPYAIKSRVLVHAHLERIPLHSSFLESDQRIILKKCPQLIQEMVNILCQLWVVHRSRGNHPPSLDMFEEVMRSSGVIVQAMWFINNSPLLQLPHLSQALLKHFRTKKRNIATIEQYIALSPQLRRSLVRTLTPEEYSDLMAVCANFPNVSIRAETQVVDDDNTELITARSLVTLSVVLVRNSLGDAGLLELGPMSSEPQQRELMDTVLEEEKEEEGVRAMRNGTPPNMAAKKTKKPVAARKKVKGQAKVRRRTVNPKKAKKSDRQVMEEGEDNWSDTGESTRKERSGRSQQERSGRSQQKPYEGSGDSSEDDDDVGVAKNEGEDEEWNRLQESVQKHSKKKHEHNKTESHPVHAPYFPEEKLEMWWLYVADKRKKEMISLPTKVSSLKTEYMTDLQFAAPDRPGHYRYSVILRSDSYLDLSFSQDIKLNVGAHQEVTGRAQWADLEKEEEEQELIEESESEADLSTSEEEEED